MTNLLRKLLFVTAALAATSWYSVSGASAQETLQTCGATVESNVATSRFARAITSTSFVNFFNAPATLTPGIVADCVVVTFNAESLCKGASPNDRCYIRALDNGTEMLPLAGGTRIFDSESTGLSAHSYSWVKRGLLLGTHTYTIQVRVGAQGTTFVLDDWFLHVQFFS
jgi:hypothetical protein